jgi:hypothetical protein
VAKFKVLHHSSSTEIQETHKDFSQGSQFISRVFNSAFLENEAGSNNHYTITINDRPITTQCYCPEQTL